MAKLGCWWIGLLMVGALGAMGCDSGTTTTEGSAGTGGTAGSGGAAGSGGTGGGLVCPDDPAEGAVEDSCGIWVSVSKGNDANTGTPGAPVATLTHAIELAEKGPGRVYACGETWTEALVIPGGVSLYGGFDCDAGWAYAGDAKRAIVTAPSAPRPIAATWIYSGSMKQAFLTDFLVESPAAAAPGGSSIGCFVRDDVPIHMIRVECAAGDGADGLDGDPADPNGQSAAAGTPGNEGDDSCGAPVSKGGTAPETVCGEGTSKGGAGGDSSVMIAASGADGEPAGDPPGGAGGLGEQLAPACTAGGTGADGASGADGLGAGKKAGFPSGRLTVEGHVTLTAEDGMPGAPGQGGGGGGATFGSTTVCGAVNSGGAAGGSGGAGGCGGKGGKAGQTGGSSIALASRGTQVLIENVVLQAGNGGNGGKGGAPQPGGAGGDGGSGGQGAGTIAHGCAGGKGGSGGQGGYGGGGAGGWSLTMGWVNAPTLVAGDIQAYQSKAGLGGEGNPAKIKSWGDDGRELYTSPMDP